MSGIAEIKNYEIPYKLLRRFETLEKSISTLGDSAMHVGVIRFKPLFTSYNSCIESFKQHYLDDFS